MESARHANLPFFWLLTRILTFRDKKVPYFNVSQQKVSYFNVSRQKVSYFEHILSCEQEFKSLVSQSLPLERILSYEQEPCEPSLSHVSFELRDWLTRSLLGSHRRCSGAALSATLESANGKLFWRIIGTSCKHSSVFSWRCSSGQLGSVNKNSQEKSNFEAEMKILRKNQTWKRK